MLRSKRTTFILTLTLSKWYLCLVLATTQATLLRFFVAFLITTHVNPYHTIWYSLFLKETYVTNHVSSLYYNEVYITMRFTVMLFNQYCFRYLYNLNRASLKYLKAFINLNAVTLLVL